MKVTHSSDPQHDLYADDPLTKMKGIGKVTSSFLHVHDIYTVKDFNELSDESILKVDNIPHHRVQKWVAEAKKALTDRIATEMIRPAINKTDYRKAENPYKERYGENWLEKIKTCAQLTAFGDIHDLVRHIVKVTSDAGKEYFYHDALSLMTCKSTMDWMKSEGYLDMWIRPQAGLFEDYADLKRFFWLRCRQLT